MGGYAPRPLAQRFWPKVNKAGDDECWPWTAATAYGYGKIGMGNNFVAMAHRVSWELHYGPIPDGLRVCHKCDNPPCVNPKHLFLGTAADNNMDRVRKGRTNRVRKIRPEQAIEIFVSLDPIADIAERTGLSASHIYAIKNGNKWSAITEV